MSRRGDDAELGGGRVDVQPLSLRFQFQRGRNLCMKPKTSSLPTTGQVLGFLVKCIGESKGNGATSSLKYETNWARHKRYERLANQCEQSTPACKETKAALIDAVAVLFDNSLKGELVSAKVLEMNFIERVQSALPRLRGGNTTEKRFTVRLIFWIVYFIEHHEWLCPQLEAAHKPDKALREWVQHTAHFCTNTLADTVRVNPSLLDGLPPNLSWNLPAKQVNGKVRWPMTRAIEWLEGLLDDQSREELPAIFYPNKDKSYSANCFRRMIREQNLPGLERIETVAKHPWRFKDKRTTISPEKLKAVLLWSHALQFALKAVEKKLGISFVWVLVERHNRATASTVEHLAKTRKGGDKNDRSNTS
jgi:hypothetical protein